MTHTVGILLDDATFKGIASRQTGYEQLSFYNKSAGRLKLRPFYMNLKKTGTRSALGYSYSSGKYRMRQGPLPKVIHNRDITLNPKLKKKLRQLAGSSVLFNRTNRFSKYKISDLLAGEGSLRPHLPVTTMYSRANLARAMKRFGSLYVKPNSGSVGSGIIKLSKSAKGDWQVYWRKGAPYTAPTARAIAFIHQKIGGQSYQIQEAIALAAYKGRPYDIRVSVQKNGSGHWQVTGMVGKVAAAGQHVTNVAKGGRVKRCEELFLASGLPVTRTKDSLRHVSLQIAEYLGRRLPHLADIGLDMGVDKQGRIKFIEMNGRDQRYSFKKAGLNATFFKTYSTPMQYAKKLLEQQVPPSK
jgi:hypothetical protein